MLSLAVAAVAGAVVVPAVSGDPGSNPVVPQPELGAADGDITLMGSSSTDAGTEAWACRACRWRHPRPSPAGTRSGSGRCLRRPSRPRSSSRSCSYTAATGWQYVETPVDQSGMPLRFLLPNSLTARITEHSGGVLVARDFEPGRRTRTWSAARPRRPLPGAPPSPRRRAPPHRGGRDRLPHRTRARGRLDDGSRTQIFLAATGPAAGRP